MLQFHAKVDRQPAYFTFDDIPPNTQPNGAGTDLCGEGICMKAAAEHRPRHVRCLGRQDVRRAELAGKLPYEGQAPRSRCVCLWGACSAGGFAEVLIAKKRKITGDDWEAAAEAGKLRRALLALNPKRRRGPWSVLCDNESCLRSAAARRGHRRARVVLWTMPPRSPDLNPIEKYWSWLRRRVLQKDLQDLREGKPVPGRMAYIARMRAINRTQQAQAVAGNCAQGLRRVCRLIVEQRGIAVHA